MPTRSPTRARRPKLAVWKFASCDGCQLSVLNLEEELLPLAGEIEIANFLEASSAVIKGPYDLSLVEGSVTTPDDARRVQQVRQQSRRLVAIGACANFGGIQALRDLMDVAALQRTVYAHPEYLATLSRSTPISAHVTVDLELTGCPVDRGQLVEVLTAFIQDRPVRLPQHSVCVECKRRGTVCVTVAPGTPCLGPVTRAGCGAICPAYHRGCYGCFGPVDGANTAAVADRARELGMPGRDVARLFRLFNTAAPAFAKEAAHHDA
jgi:coenzyme F420-reducing hydrogenase gamma subunit